MYTILGFENKKVKLINQSKKTVLSSNAKMAVSFFDRTFGLLSKRNPRSLVFDTHFGLHTFGMTVPIDILVLDQQSRVKKIGKGIKPNRLFFYNPFFHLIIELPEGTVDSTQTAIDDKIIFE